MANDEPLAHTAALIKHMSPGIGSSILEKICKLTVEERCIVCDKTTYKLDGIKSRRCKECRDGDMAKCRECGISYPDDEWIEWEEWSGFEGSEDPICDECFNRDLINCDGCWEKISSRYCVTIGDGPLKDYHVCRSCSMDFNPAYGQSEGEAKPSEEGDGQTIGRV